MYCSSCGGSVPPGLSYCNRCGADLRPKENEDPKRPLAPNFLVAGIVFVTIFGIIAVMMLMGVMSQMLRASEGVINGFAAVAFFLILLVDALFAFLLLRSKKSPGENADVIQLKEAIRAELHAAQTSGLAQPAGSVTDHTTRTLEHVPRKD